MHNDEKPLNKRAQRMQTMVGAANYLSLSFSIVIAILIGIGIGILLAKIYKPLFFFGVALGVAAAILNVYRAYQMLLRINTKKDSKTDNE